MSRTTKAGRAVLVLGQIALLVWVFGRLGWDLGNQ